MCPGSGSHAGRSETMSRARQALPGFGLANQRPCLEREPCRHRSSWAVLANELEAVDSLLEALDRPDNKVQPGAGRLEALRPPQLGSPLSARFIRPFLRDFAVAGSPNPD
jgi:hypothetical protein